MKCELENCRLLSLSNVVVTHQVTRGGIVEGEIELNFHTTCADKYLKQCEEQRNDTRRI